ncbi:DUF1338 domain-containing protein [Shewanella sp. NFH-SH190041]|uniref:DUF1338 domain-containing protein n=1 Tax=Shewanella sp. NFH-SH190041 TaxID=2950245 RepID=UPI0021C26632|nr:DUF1338 domain-containing protein [Shewanella sp. NFH-SH190041]BDM63250.1 DUF1338 domain-containing protein [Shewanella sp. NFH-SH190041]
MHTDVNQLFAAMWQDYIQMTPSAAKVHQLLGQGQSGGIINDHIALRTFDLPQVNLSVLAAHFEALGYVACGEYHFKAKKLYARHFEHPDPTQPKVFISELLLAQCSDKLQQTVANLLEQLPPEAVKADNFLYSGRHWQLDTGTYETLLAESEYAAWVAAFGYRANHFTVSVNHLQAFDSLAEINQTLKQHGFVLNTAGGEIKGSAEVLLEQSSTMADKLLVTFSDGQLMIPSCFYEFALRYPMADGTLYPGFVAASADKIFESTHAAGRQD